MLLEGVFNVFFTLISFLISLIPSTGSTVSGSISSVLDLLGYGIYIVGPVCFVTVVGSFITWTTINFAWAIIEWIYKKIPGIN